DDLDALLADLESTT
nr:Chain E, Paxillin LD1 peptide [Homo sapiens]